MLANPITLKRFVPDAADVKAMLATFTGLYSLDADEYIDGKAGLDRVLDMVANKPEVGPGSTKAATAWTGGGSTQHRYTASASFA